jgi:hypothetical protein
VLPGAWLGAKRPDVTLYEDAVKNWRAQSTTASEPKEACWLNHKWSMSTQATSRRSGTTPMPVSCEFASCLEVRTSTRTFPVQRTATLCAPTRSGATSTAR